MSTQDEKNFSEYETEVALKRERATERKHDLWRENWGI